jgi:hypothetical protein
MSKRFPRGTLKSYVPDANFSPLVISRRKTGELRPWPPERHPAAGVQARAAARSAHQRTPRRSTSQARPSLGRTSPATSKASGRTQAAIRPFSPARSLQGQAIRRLRSGRQLAELARRTSRRLHPVPGAELVLTFGWSSRHLPAETAGISTSFTIFEGAHIRTSPQAAGSPAPARPDHR